MHVLRCLGVPGNGQPRLKLLVVGLTGFRAFGVRESCRGASSDVRRRVVDKGKGCSRLGEIPAGIFEREGDSGVGVGACGTRMMLREDQSLEPWARGGDTRT